jgi:hypothetical protein
MSLQREQQSRLAKIRALLAKAEATEFPAEAEALSARAAELMGKHSIDQAMLDAAEAVTEPAKTAGKRVIMWDGKAEYAIHQSVLLNAIAEHNACAAVHTTGGIGERIVIFGYTTDLDLTEMLYTSLLLQAGNALAAEDIPFGDTPRSFCTAWWAAYASRIATRLSVMRADAERSAEAGKPGTAVILRQRKDAVMLARKADFPQTRAGRGARGGKSRAGRAAGYAAGSRASLGTGAGISGGSASRALPGGN